MSPYRTLAIVSAIHLVIMFLLTYTMIASLDHFYANINRVYMAVLMVSPMVIIMLVAMPSMFANSGLNRALIAGFAVLFAVVFILTRTQTPVGNRQFLRSMIPHHSSAILMCEEASITDPDISKLCDQIVRSQRQEIAEMQSLLQRD